MRSGIFISVFAIIACVAPENLRCHEGSKSSIMTTANSSVTCPPTTKYCFIGFQEDNLVFGCGNTSGAFGDKYWFMHECNEEKANIVTETKGKISCCSESLCNSVTRDLSFLGAAAFVLFAVLLH